MAFVRKSGSNGVVDSSSDGSSIAKHSENGQKNIIQIYTDWANHYLEKGGFRGRINCLHADVVDGTLISDVIESITGKPVAAIDRHPETKEQHIENIRQCLFHLKSLHVTFDDIDPGHVAEGKLKPILSLFFQLSRHKQQLQQLKKKSGVQMRSGQVGQLRAGHVQGSRTSQSGLSGHNHTGQSSQLASNHRSQSRSAVSAGKSGALSTGQLRERQQTGEGRAIQKPSSSSISTPTGNFNNAGVPCRLNGASGRSLTPNSSRAAAPGSNVPSLKNSYGSKLGSICQLREAPAASNGVGSSDHSHRAVRAGERSLGVTNYGVVSRNSSDTSVKSQLSYSGKRDSSSSGVSSTRSSYSNGTDTASENTLMEPETKSIPTTTTTTRSLNTSGGLVRKSAAPVSSPPHENSLKPPDSDSTTTQRGAGRSMLQQPRSRVARSGGSGALPSSGTSIAVSNAKRRSLVGSQSSLASTSSVGSGIGGACVAPRGSVSGKSTLPRQQRRFGNGRGTNVALVSPMPHVSNGKDGGGSVQLQQEFDKSSTTKPQQVHPASSSNGIISVDCRDAGSPVTNRRSGSDGGSRDDARTSSPVTGGVVNPGTDPRTGSDRGSSAEDVCSVRPMRPLLRLGRLEYGKSLSSPSNKHHIIGSKPATVSSSQQGERRGMTSTDPGRPGSLTDGYMSEGGGSRPLSAQHNNRKLPQLRYSSGDTGEWIEETAPFPAASTSTAVTPASVGGDDKNIKQLESGDEPAAEIFSTETNSSQLSQRPVNLSHDLNELSLTAAGFEPLSQQSANTANNGEIPKTAIVRRGSASLEKHISAAGWYSSLPSENQLLNGHHHSASSAAPPSEGGSVTPSRPRTRFKISDSTQTEWPSWSERPVSAHRHQLPSSAASTASQSHIGSGPAAQQLPHRQQLGGDVGASRISTESPYAGYMQWRCHAGLSGGQRPNSAYTAHVAPPPNHHSLRGCLTDAESVESMGGVSSDLLLSQQQQQQYMLRSSAASPAMSPQLSNSSAARQLANLGWECQYQSPKLYRSNSIRSTKSEQVYSSLLQRQWQQKSSTAVASSSVDDPIYGHTTVEATNNADSAQPMSPTRCSGSAPRSNAATDDVRGSSQSLVSNTSSIYSSQEDKLAVETRRLRRELTESQQKIQSLTNQLNTNAHVVEAFEQSLASMTKKMHALSSTNEQKDRQISELRRNLHVFRQGAPLNSSAPPSPHHSQRSQQHGSTESLSSISSSGSGHSQHQEQQQQQRTPLQNKLPLDRDAIKKKKKKGWFAASPQLRNSFGKAFTRRKSRAFPTDCDESGSPLTPNSSPSRNNTGSSPVRGGGDNSCPSNEQVLQNGSATPISTNLTESVEKDLRRELQLKDSALTELRLQTLATHTQLETLRESAASVRREMALVRQDNERLQQLLAARCLSPSASAPVVPPTGTARTTTTSSDEDDRVLSVLVLPDSPAGSSVFESRPEALMVGHVRVGRTTSWSTLDERLAVVFREYMSRVDPSQAMSVGWEAALQYELADLTRPLSCQQSPDLLPWGYVVGDVTQLFVTLAGHRQGALDAFIFQNLVPRAIAHRFVSLLMERRRVILGGQSGTGKTFLAHRLAEHVVASCGDGSISSFTVQPSGEEQLQLFLQQLLADKHRQTATQVVIIDDLHHVTSSETVMTSLAAESRSHSDLYIIGTSGEVAAPSSLPTCIGWLPCVCHMEPASGLLARCLRRKQTTASLTPSSVSSANQQQMPLVFDWIPRVWKQLNSFIELHCSSQATIGPCVLLDCPYDVEGSQRWFSGVWNRVLAPHVQGEVRRALLSHGRRASWHDPVHFVADSYPWQQSAPHGLQSLTRLPADQVGYHVDGASPQPTSDHDPLLEMLRSLQQAAEYSGPCHDNSAPTQQEETAEYSRPCHDNSAPTQQEETAEYSRSCHNNSAPTQRTEAAQFTI